MKKGEIDKKRRSQLKKILKENMKKTLLKAGFLKEWKATMYNKLHELFDNYFNDIFSGICILSAFDAWKLAETLLFNIV